MLRSYLNHPSDELCTQPVGRNYAPSESTARNMPLYIYIYIYLCRFCNIGYNKHCFSGVHCLRCLFTYLLVSKALSFYSYFLCRKKLKMDVGLDSFLCIFPLCFSWCLTDSLWIYYTWYRGSVEYKYYIMQSCVLV